jgi:co-chaperonin GroES (HSP10)
LADRVLLKSDDQKEVQSTSGILLSKAEKGEIWKGKIISTGPAVQEDLVGKTAHFRGFSADAIEIDGVKHQIVSIDDVLCTE